MLLKMPAADTNNVKCPQPEFSEKLYEDVPVDTGPKIDGWFC